jgi:hypothetical protein
MSKEELQDLKQKRDALVQLWDRIDENHKRIINSENMLYEWRVRKIMEELGNLNDAIQQYERTEETSKKR